MKAHVACLGCEQRHLDAERIRAFLRGNEVDLVSAQEAELIFVVTCAVDARSERASLAEVQRMAALRGRGSRLIVGGCLPSISPEKLTPFAITKTFSPRSLTEVEDFVPNVRLPLRDVPDAHQDPGHRANAQYGRRGQTAREEYDMAKQGFMIRINHGCRLSCSYCVIRLATGRLESVPVDTIVRSFRDAIERREPSIMLLGGDTGAWGLDIGTRFSSLLGTLLSFEGQHRLFIHDLNANWLVRDIEGVERALRRGAEHLRAMCIPVQSGSDRILRQMRRPYSCDDVRRALRTIRQCAPHVALGTHVMVGFPGESTADFHATISFLRDVDFDFVTCFRYSEHVRADSAILTPKIPEEVSSQRLDELRYMLRERATVIA